ncbi:MAG: cytochrome C biogenesis protein [Acidobacteria bacterium]|nr:MAG: cytochrome C biogenesis protein [Acidobacteriota bacterium]
MKLHPLMLLAGVLALPSPLRAGPELDPLRAIAIQDGGRVKPFDTFARETARRVSGATPFTGGESVKGMDPVEWILSMLSDPQRWRDERIVKVSHAGLRAAAGLPPKADQRYSFAELTTHAGFLAAADKVHEKLRQDREARLDPVEREISTLYDTLGVMNGIFSGEALRIVPHPTDRNAAWFSLADLDRVDQAPIQRIKTLTAALITAYQGGDKASVQAAASALGRRLAELAPGVYPAAKDLGVEIQYNHVKPFRFAWIAYLLGFLLLLASFPLAAKWIGRAGIALVLTGFAFHVYGMGLRVYISGVAWGAMLFALIFEAVYKARYFAVAAAGLATLCLILADNVPILDGSIEPLVPVLRDNMWLTVHVLTITLGYAAFLLGMGLGHVNLGLYFFAPRKTALFKTLSLFLYRALQVGTLLLATGTMLGGVWASYSWGRFWGWDPKETWAFIALLGYLAVLHARMVGWIREFGMAVGSILGFLLVLMAWYGVNFVLGTGLHSYGFGSGGYMYVGGFVAFEVLVIVAALLRRRSEEAKKRLAVPAGSLQPAS